MGDVLRVTINFPKVSVSKRDGTEYLKLDYGSEASEIPLATIKDLFGLTEKRRPGKQALSEEEIVEMCRTYERYGMTQRDIAAIRGLSERHFRRYYKMYKEMQNMS